jgi:hypothetical protein
MLGETPLSPPLRVARKSLIGTAVAIGLPLPACGERVGVRGSVYEDIDVRWTRVATT